MPGTYVVNFTDPNNGQIVIEPLTANQSTSLFFAGYRYPVYGEAQWENLLHLLENFASPKPPTAPVQGQLWADTLTSPATLKIYDRVNGAGVWNKIGENFIVSTTAPTSKSALWFDPSNSTLNYWDGSAWKNILEFVIANTVDYNAIAAEMNEILTSYGQPTTTILPSSTAATSAHWTQLIAKIRQLATYRQLPDRIVSKLVYEDNTKFTSDSSNMKTMFTLISFYDRMLRALDMIDCCDKYNVDPQCYDMRTPPSGTKVQTSEWDDVTHIGVFAHSNATASDVYFRTGGKYTWTGAFDAVTSGTPETDRNATWESFLDKIGPVEFDARGTWQNGVRTGVGYEDLTNVDRVLFAQTARMIYYSYYQQNASVTISGKKSPNGTVTLSVRYFDPDPNQIAGTLTSTFTLTRVGSPCLDVAPEFPIVSSQFSNTTDTGCCHA